MLPTNAGVLVCAPEPGEGERAIEGVEPNLMASLGPERVTSEFKAILGKALRE
ncbi:MAG: hypothetical protein ACFE0I_11760 [Elainellaceae cyanobacterium]